MVDLAGNRTPSIEQSCLTETTDCPSDVSVITSISCLPPTRVQQPTLSPMSSTSSATREESLANRLGQTNVKEEETIQRAGERSSSRLKGDQVGSRRPQPTHHFLPPTQLRALVRDRLQAEGIRLSSHPYTQSVRNLTFCTSPFFVQSIFLLSLCDNTPLLAPISGQFHGAASNNDGT